MYKIVVSKKVDLPVAVREVESEVNELKTCGWIEQGGVSICHSICNGTPGFTTNYYTVAQVMVKNEK